MILHSRGGPGDQPALRWVHPDPHLDGGHPIWEKSLLAQRATGNDMRMLRAVLEQFWPSRRMDAFDQFCS
jgi:hypothetical protein